MKLLKNMKVAVWALFVALAFCSCDDDDNITAPSAASKALSGLYPTARDVEWEKKGIYYVADCKVDGMDMDIWFSAEGAWLLSETDYSWAGLPQAVCDAFSAGQYAAWTIDDVDKLEYPSRQIRYVIEVEQARMEIQLFYDENGVLQDTKDVTGRDDTHWPV